MSEKHPDSDDVELAKSKTVRDDVNELYASKISQKLLTLGVETRGVLPVPEEERTDTQIHKIFFIWFTANCNILSYSAGTLGPVIWGLGVRDSCLVIFFFNLLCCAFPAYFCTWGPKFGLRQMVQARFSFGLYGVILPCIFNLIGMLGFSVLNCILGGETLASVADGNLSWTVGIVIVAIIALLVSFSGWTVINWYERIAWFPVLLGFLVIVGVAGKNFASFPGAEEPASATGILSFASVIAGFTITWSTLGSDFTCYYRPDVPSWKLFLYAYFGFLLPTALLQCLGAVSAATSFQIASWDEAHAAGGVGGLLSIMLSPVGGFGKFLVVLMSFSVIGNIAMTFYSIGLNIQVFIPALVRVPRYVLAILAMVIVLPLAIAGQHRFYETLSNFLGLIGYWATAFISIILLEHLYFRSNTVSNYDLSTWNTATDLPSGISALLALVCSFGLIIPCMDQVWFVGPIAKTTGDIGFEVAFFIAGSLYFVLRSLELKLRKGTWKIKV